MVEKNERMRASLKAIVSSPILSISKNRAYTNYVRILRGLMAFSMSTPAAKSWLLKAEPDTRIVKSKDVKVSLRLIYHSDGWTSVVKYVSVQCR